MDPLNKTKLHIHIFQNYFPVIFFVVNLYHFKNILVTKSLSPKTPSPNLRNLIRNF